MMARTETSESGSEIRRQELACYLLASYDTLKVLL